MTKYKAVRTEVDGIKFASKKEARRYAELLILQRAKKIANLELQVPFLLTCNGKPLLYRSERYKNGRKAKYIADFGYSIPGGNAVIEDCKGKRTEIYLLKRAIMESMGHTILET